MNKLLAIGLRLLAVCFWCLAPVSLHAQQLRLEYFFDHDPGFGQGQWMTVTTEADGSYSFLAPTTGLTPGSHLLGFRAYKPGSGDVPTHFAPTILQEVYVPQSETPAINYVEYFWDTEPGAGKGTKLDITPTSELNLTDVQIPITGLSKGSHLLGIRAKGERGWSPVILQEVYVPAATADGCDITYAEYFWDTDPGFGKGTPLPFTKGQEISIDNAEISVEELSAGDHNLYVRAYGNNGWTPTIAQTVYIEPNTTDWKVWNAEYFWNEDPGYGQATPIALTPGKEVSIQDFTVPTDLVHGDAVLYVRYRSDMGWSPTVAYPVMVNAYGEYTLNASKETSLADRIYKSVTDAFFDFDDRGISDNITLKAVTKNIVYELDATDETMLNRLARMAKNLDDISVARDHKTIAFKRNATSNTGNSVKVTTTTEGMPTVVSLFAQTSQDNVALTINEVAYDFTPASQRWQIGCGTTTAVALSSISEAIKATWQAQPHEGTTLTGFSTEGEGDLPEMTITNNGTETDSVAYRVTLSSADGEQHLCSYTYYIYVYAPMQNQAFTTLLPATGSSVDPVATTLEWNAFNDATGYRLTVTATDGEGNAVTVKDASNKVLTDYAVNGTSYTLTVNEGYTYTWTVTAVGPCDEMTSPEMTLKGRLLPDLVVESINLPEAAPAGTELTVTATIKNQGQGATTEGEWTDRLYYTVNSTKFADAVQAADVKHEGNIDPDGTYDVTFTMTVPDGDSGTLRVFVETNADKAAMEHDATANNNRLMSSTTANMAPVYIDETDLTALLQLYNDFGGSEWNGTKWNTASVLVSSGNWSGVTFNAEGHVTAIKLQARGLTGNLSVDVPYIASMSQLTTLNLSRNALKGDPAKYLQGVGAQLKTVDLSYNQINELSAALPATITALTLESQHRKYNATGTLPGLEELSTQTLYVGSTMELEQPSVVGYDHKSQSFGNIQTLKVYKLSAMSSLLGYLRWNEIRRCYHYDKAATIQPQEQDDDVVLVPSDGAFVNSAYPATFHMVFGDANLTGWVDVNDVQRTLNYVIDSNNSSIFSLWAANTWDADDIINIQDIVCTVNIVLENEGADATPTTVGGPDEASRRAAAAANRFYAAGRYIYLQAQDEVAAFDLEIAGINPTQVKLLLNRNDWQMQTRETEQGTRLLVFSPTGQTLLPGETQLLRMSSDGEPTAAQATNAEASDVPVSVGNGHATGIAGIDNSEEIRDNRYYDLQGRKVEGPRNATLPKGEGLKKGLYIKNGKKVIR